MKLQPKERILIAAKHVFAEKGFDGARMGEIAGIAKVNQAMLHYYFKSKEHLYETMLHKLFAIEQAEVIVKLWEEYSLEPPERLYIQMYVLMQLNAHPEDPEFERILYSLLGGGGEKKIISLARKVLFPMFQSLEKNIQAGMLKGVFETKDAFFEAIQIFLFSTRYKFFSRFFEKSDWHSHLYGEGSMKAAFDFFISHTFKSLCPAAKQCIIPVIPDNIINEIDKTINIIVKDIRGGFND